MSAGQSHYFDERPTGPGQERRRTVELQGRSMDVVTSSGVFSGDRLDLGTQVLLRHAGPVPAEGHLLDLGCGWGPITLALAAAAPGATVWAVDVNERARALTAANARDNGFGQVNVRSPGDVDPDVSFALIWSNPPIRIGKDALHSLLLAWLPRLAPGGRAELVVQRNLGADSLHTWLEQVLPDGMTVTRSASSKGYRVLVVSRPVTG
ncbi:class I SAM-dependent methyltransferase [Aquipuribacter sp. MA13-13]|uniref:class I SAM-dependent methyltransferase n=1 Tax=Aquipuribacter sp. MA13-13 TaxID=3440840 RepID=UPI003EEAD1DC